MIKKVEDLNVYKRSYKLALEIHKETLKFPSEDRFELGSQMRRASKSIPSNIAEGFSKRKFLKEYKRYLNIARASNDEMFNHLKFARDLGYFDERKYQKFVDEYTIVGKQLTNLIKTWEKFDEI